MSAEKIRIIVISSVRPEPTSAGPIVLHRHLVNQPWIDLEVYGSEPTRRTLRSLIRRGIGQLKKIGLGNWSEAIWSLWKGGWLDEHLPREVDSTQPTVVLTVAHGDVCHTARRFARKHNLPLVVWFQDWWPDSAEVPGFFRPILERHFRDLYQSADLALCICEGMKEELGHHQNSVVLAPVSEEREMNERKGDENNPSPEFKVIYSGNLRDYGPMIGSLIRESLNHPDLLIQARGDKPDWEPDFIEAMTKEGRLLPFASRDEFNQWSQTADAFIVPMVFDPKMRRRMRTSFPSKLIEFAQFGKPLIIWGPEDCSAIRFLKNTGFGIYVTSPNPQDVIGELLSLQADSRKYRDISHKTVEVAAENFAPVALQIQFRKLVTKLVFQSGGPFPESAAL